MLRSRDFNVLISRLHTSLRGDTITPSLFNVCDDGGYVMVSRAAKKPMHFKSVAQADVPQGRTGKHKQIVSTILNDLDRLKDGSALKVPLGELAESKEKVRSALSRATRKVNRNVATASDTEFLYIWNERE